MESSFFCIAPILDQLVARYHRLMPLLGRKALRLQVLQLPGLRPVRLSLLTLLLPPGLLERVGETSARRSTDRNESITILLPLLLGKATEAGLLARYVEGTETANPVQI